MNKLDNIDEQELYAMLGVHAMHASGMCHCDQCEAIFKELEKRTKQRQDDPPDALAIHDERHPRHSIHCVYIVNDRGGTEWCCAEDCKVAHRVR